MSISWVEPTTNGGLIAVYSDGKRTPLVNVGAGRWVVKNRPVLLKDDGSPYELGDFDTDPGNAGGGISITAQMIEAGIRGAGGSVSNALQSPAQIAAGFNNAISKTYPGMLTSKKRAACFIGQSAAETGGFALVKEVMAGPNDSAELRRLQARYIPYIGRGWIQITWKTSYLAFGKWLKKMDVIENENMFVENPDKLAELEWAPYTTVYQFTQETWAPHGNLLKWSDTQSSPWTLIGKCINNGSPYAEYPLFNPGGRQRATDAVMAVTPNPDSADQPSSDGYAWPCTTRTISDSYPGHAGIDIACPMREKLFAVEAGKITYVGFGRGWGNAVFMTDVKGVRWVYGHCDETRVNVGQAVKRGEHIAWSGNTGRSSGPHLHIEATRGSLNQVANRQFTAGLLGVSL